MTVESTRNRITRLGTRILSVIGQGLGLSKITSLQNLYGRIARQGLPDSDLWIMVDGQRMLIPSPRHNIIGQMLYMHGAWEEAVTRFLCGILHPGMTVMDVGAHIGYYTLLMAKRITPDGRVFSFEPNPAVRKYLEENIRANGYSSIDVFPFALFSRDGVGVLEGQDNLNSCLKPDMAKGHEDLVQFARFDGIQSKLGIDRIDVIKMDVEGAEMDILIGMQNYLKAHYPALIIEVHLKGLPQFGYDPAAPSEFLRALGYSVSNVWAHINTTTVYCVKNPAQAGIP
jgi:FkbM family methyltransferase